MDAMSVVSTVLDTAAGVGSLRSSVLHVAQLPMVGDIHPPELITVAFFDEGRGEGFEDRGAGYCILGSGDICAQEIDKKLPKHEPGWPVEAADNSEGAEGVTFLHFR